MASAKPVTRPLASCVGVAETAATTPLVPRDTLVRPGRSPSPRAAPALSPQPGPSAICDRSRPRTSDPPWATTSPGPATRGRMMRPTSSSLRRRARASRSRRYTLRTESKYPVPEASERSVTSSSNDVAPESLQVSQSCGRQTAAMRAAASGSWSASHRSLVIVSEATGTLPTPSAQAARPAASSPQPSSTMRSWAADAERVSFHRSAGRMISPPASRTTMPCCWPPTLSAATSSRPSAASTASPRARHH